MFSSNIHLIPLKLASKMKFSLFIHLVHTVLSSFFRTIDKTTVCTIIQCLLLFVYWKFMLNDYTQCSATKSCLNRPIRIHVTSSNMFLIDVMDNPHLT